MPKQSKSFFNGFIKRAFYQDTNSKEMHPTIFGILLLKTTAKF